MENKEKFDLIIIDDEMKPDNALDILKSLKKIKNFNTPIVVMLKEEKMSLKKHYLEDGFKYCLNKNNLKKELETVIEKILK